MRTNVLIYKESILPFDVIVNEQGKSVRNYFHYVQGVSIRNILCRCENESLKNSPFFAENNGEGEERLSGVGGMIPLPPRYDITNVCYD